jgi:photosystem II stability/assembly factor-like uncharacterized protein
MIMKNLLFLVFLILVVSLHAQWTKTSGPSGSIISCTQSKGTSLFVGTKTVGIYRSIDNGASWVLINNGLGIDLEIRSIAVSGQNLVVGTYAYIYVSANNGDTWVKKETGILNIKGINALATNESMIFANLHTKGIARSIDGGNNWTLSSTALVDKNVQCLFWSGNKLYAGTNQDGVFVSNNGETWSEANNGIPVDYRSIRSIMISDNNLYACSYPGGVYKSIDNGATWTVINNGLTNISCRYLFAKGSDLFVSTDNGIHRLTDGGINWIQANTGIPIGYPNTFMVNGNTIFVGVANNGIYKSIDNGNHWSPSSNGMMATSIKSLVKSGSTLYAGAYYSGGIFSTSTGGNSWNPSFPSVSSVIQVITSGNDIYAATNGHGIFKSQNNGSTWTALTPVTGSSHIYSVAKAGNNLFAGTAGIGVYKSGDDGTTWAEVNEGLTSKTIHMLTPVGNNLFAATSNGLFLSKNNGSNWALSGLPGINIITVKADNNKIYAGTWGEGVFVSSDDGTSWEKKNNGLTALNVYAIAFDTNHNLYVSAGANVYVSKDGGNNWASISQGIPYNVWSLEVMDGYLYAGIELNGVWKRAVSELLHAENLEKTEFSGSMIKQVHPNPFNNETIISYHLNEISPVLVKIFTVSGVEIVTIIGGTKTAGDHAVVINSNELNLPGGIYICRLYAGDKTESVKLLKR